MLEIYKSTETKMLEQVDKVSKGCWINMYAPTEEEINRVADEANIYVDLLETPLMMKNVQELSVKMGRFISLSITPILRTMMQDSLSMKPSQLGLF